MSGFLHLSTPYGLLVLTWNNFLNFLLNLKRLSNFKVIPGGASHRNWFRGVSDPTSSDLILILIVPNTTVSDFKKPAPPRNQKPQGLNMSLILDGLFFIKKLPIFTWMRRCDPHVNPAVYHPHARNHVSFFTWPCPESLANLLEPSGPPPVQFSVVPEVLAVFLSSRT
jgi:hypothetical protein